MDTYIFAKAVLKEFCPILIDIASLEHKDRGRTLFLPQGILRIMKIGIGVFPYDFFVVLSGQIQHLFFSLKYRHLVVDFEIRDKKRSFYF